MTRSDGFRTADIDVSLLSDPKFRKLGRLLPKAGALSEAIVLYLSTVLESWAAGERVRADDAAPLWMRNHATMAASLQEADLLDADRMLPEKSWDGWYGPANARREARRTAGRAGGLVNRTSSKPQATLEQSSDSPASEPRPVPLPIRTEPIRSAPTNGHASVEGDTIHDVVHRLTAVFLAASSKNGGRLDRWVEKLGRERVERELRETADDLGGLPETNQLLNSTEDRLFPTIAAPSPKNGEERETPAQLEKRREQTKERDRLDAIRLAYLEGRLNADQEREMRKSGKWPGAAA